jgi:hypothetical protein
MEERRRFLRLQSWLTASYQVVGESKPLESIIRNTSAGGLGFLTKSRLAPGTILEVTVVFPDERRTIRFTGEVCWSGPLLLLGKPPNPPRAFETGIRVLRIAPEDQAFLLNSTLERPDAGPASAPHAAA